MLCALIVDHDERRARALATSIDWQNFHFSEVEIVATCQEAKTYIETHCPELICIEADLPDNMMQHLVKDIQEVTSCKVILSDQLDYHCMKYCMQHRISDYLVRPIDKEEFENIVAHIYETVLLKDNHILDVFEPIFQTVTGDYYVTHMTDYIKMNYHQPMTIQSLADLNHISASYAARLFKQTMGISILDYILRYRVYQSLALLRSGLACYEIAAQTGFSDYKNYAYHFKKYMKCCPKDFKAYLGLVHIED